MRFVRSASIFLILFTLAALPVATRAQNCNADITATAPDSRYTDNGDGTVTDNTTGLMWIGDGNCILNYHASFDTDHTPDGAVTWQNALDFAAEVRAGTYDCSLGTTYDDWRLPNRNELASLLENKCDNPAINERFFPNTESAAYWSSSPSAVNAANAWFVNFATGQAIENVDKTMNYYVRLVRTAP